MSHSFTPEERRLAHLEAQSEAAREKRAATVAAKRRLINEDIVVFWDGRKKTDDPQRRMVPLAIAARLKIPVDRVTAVLREEGYELPSYLTTTGPTPEADTCPHCGKTIE